jgi:hypothetical protein
VVFRWAAWGELSRSPHLLRHSVGTFHRWFGSGARYVVCTDEPLSIRRAFGGLVDVVSMGESPFDVPARTPWKKWNPAVRLFPGETEVQVDSDVFVVGDPHELRVFVNGPGDGFLVMRESRPEAMYGVFQEWVAADLPPINIGLVGQQPRADLTDDLSLAFARWRSHVRGDLGQFHDEQGAIASALAPHFRSGRARVLPAERYKIVSPRSNPDLADLQGVAMIHATWPNHPAFERFRDTILANSDCA